MVTQGHGPSLEASAVSGQGHCFEEEVAASISPHSVVSPVYEQSYGLACLRTASWLWTGVAVSISPLGKASPVYEQSYGLSVPYDSLLAVDWRGCVNKPTWIG